MLILLQQTGSFPSHLVMDGTQTLCGDRTSLAFNGDCHQEIGGCALSALFSSCIQAAESRRFHPFMNPTLQTARSLAESRRRL